ncbi:MAG: sugar phosphate isomerase/epimerase family protein, partial [Bacteroidota bacterium]
DGFRDENFAKAFEILPQTGIKNVEFNVWYGRTVTPSGLASIRERCVKRGLRPISLQGKSFGGELVKDLTHKLWTMQQAKELGCRRVKFSAAKRGQAGGLDRIIEVLKELAPVAEEKDVLICLENNANSNLETIADFEKVFAAIDSTHVGLNLDMGHFDGAGVNNFEVVEMFYHKINHIDIKDCAHFGQYKTVPYGSGITEGEAIVRALLDKAYSGYLVIEQAPPRSGVELAIEMERIRDRFKSFER